MGAGLELNPIWSHDLCGSSGGGTATKKPIPSSKHPPSLFFTKEEAWNLGVQTGGAGSPPVDRREIKPCNLGWDGGSVPDCSTHPHGDWQTPGALSSHAPGNLGGRPAPCSRERDRSGLDPRAGGCTTEQLRVDRFSVW